MNKEKIRDEIRKKFENKYANNKLKRGGGNSVQREHVHVCKL
jgi:hypothetical protein